MHNRPRRVCKDHQHHINQMAIIIGQRNEMKHIPDTIEQKQQNDHVLHHLIPISRIEIRTQNRTLLDLVPLHRRRHHHLHHQR